MTEDHDHGVDVLAPLTIGIAVFMVHLATAPITGTGINPAKSFGTALIYNNQKVWKDHWIFWLGLFARALTATVYHQIILKVTSIKALMAIIIVAICGNPTN